MDAMVYQAWFPSLKWLVGKLLLMIWRAIESRLNGISTQTFIMDLMELLMGLVDDVDYHTFHPFYQVGYFDLDSRMDLCHTVYQKDCPEQGGVDWGCCSPCWK
jgi:hypothetical protein